MHSKNMLPRIFLGIGLFGVASSYGVAAETGRVSIEHNTPKFTASAQDLGPSDPTKTMEVSIWLKPHNKATLDAIAKDLYDPKSPNFRHFLSHAEFAAKFAPTAAEAKSVQDFLTASNLKIVSVGPNNFYVRASGTTSDVSKAFSVTLHDYEVDGKTVRGNTGDPSVKGPAAQVVAAVAGLDTMGYTHPLVSKTSGLKLPATAPGGPTSNAVSGPGTYPFDSACFTGKETESFTSAGSLPDATYTGNAYANASDGCGYIPKDIQEAYNLTGLYKEGYDGKGQTIVIVDWCGSPTITQDANAFSAQFGLPALTPANFQIINTAPSYCAAPDAEINIDVEWAHAIAPGASIDLVVPPSASFQDIDEGVFYAVNYGLGSVISGSYGSEEYYTPPSYLVTEDLISETAAVLGISTDFSSGDDGDFTFDFPKYYPKSVSAPADSPYATAVGGVSLSLASNHSINWQTGWGTNINLLDDESEVPDTPAINGFFNFGSGGGASAFYAKPAYQSKVPGGGRQVPDISWLADPYTGGYIAISVPFAEPELQYEVYGGTSLACPMFSALWAIANQEYGAPLGQAAPYLYTLPATAVTDIVPVGSTNDVTGTVTTTKKTTSYTAAQLAAPLEGSTTFISALWNYPLYQDVVYLLTFGTDSGLKVTTGYDNVTGVGVPNGKAFADYFKP